MTRKEIPLNLDTGHKMSLKNIMKTGLNFLIILLSISLLYTDMAISQTKKESIKTSAPKNYLF